MKTTELILQSDVWRRDSGKGFFWLDSLFRCNCCFIRTWKSFLWLNLIKWLRITNLYTQNSRTVLYMKHDFVKFQVCSHMHPWCTHTCTHLTITSSIPAARTTRSLQNVLRSPAKSLFLLLKCCSMLMSRCLNHKKKKMHFKGSGLFGFGRNQARTHRCEDTKGADVCWSLFFVHCVQPSPSLSGGRH